MANVQVQPEGGDGGNQLLWFEDLQVGREFLSVAYEITQGEIIAFAQRYDPQPFHIDPKAAEESFFRGLAASGWHTAAVSMRLISQSIPLAWGVIGAGTDHLSWPQATRPGDVLRVHSVVEELRPQRSRPDRGIAIVRCTTHNQRDETVQVVVPRLIVPMRNSRE